MNDDAIINDNVDDNVDDAIINDNVDDAIFNDNVNIAILANKASTAKDLLDRLQTAYENLLSGYNKAF